MVATSTLLATLSNTVDSLFEYKFVYGSAWYVSPPTNIIWNWNSYTTVKGKWYFGRTDGESFRDCNDNGNVGSCGIGCGNVIVPDCSKKKAMIGAVGTNTYSNHYFGNSNTDNVKIYIRCKQGSCMDFRKVVAPTTINSDAEKNCFHSVIWKTG
jgi:hypothetical protein